MPRHHHHHRGRGQANPLSVALFFVFFFLISALRQKPAGPAKPSAPLFPNVQAQWEAFLNGAGMWLTNLTMAERLVIGGVVGAITLTLVVILGLMYWQAQSHAAEQGLHRDF